MKDVNYDIINVGDQVQKVCLRGVFKGKVFITKYTVRHIDGDIVTLVDGSWKVACTLKMVK